MARDWDGAVGAFRFESQQGPKKKNYSSKKKKISNLDEGNTPIRHCCGGCKLPFIL